MRNPIFRSRRTALQKRIEAHAKSTGTTFADTLREDFASADGLAQMEQLIDKLSTGINAEIARLCAEFTDNSRQLLEIANVKRTCETQMNFVRRGLLPVVRDLPENRVVRGVAARTFGELYGYQQALKSDLFA